MEYPSEVEMRDAVVNLDVSVGRSAVARGLQSDWMIPWGSWGMRIRRSDGKALTWIPAASRDVARQAIGSRFVNGNGCDSESSTDEGETNGGSGEALEHNSQWMY